MKAIRNVQVVMWSALLAMALAQVACSVNPVAKAETIEQKAFATYGTYVIVKEQAAKLVTSGQVSPRTVIAIGEARDRANPIVESLVASAMEFQTIREEYERGGTDAETRYIAAMNNLNSWVTRAAPLVADLVVAVQGGRQ